MTSRERVTKALQREEIDRIPLDLGCGGPNSAIDKLYSHFGTADGEKLRKVMNIDIRHVGPQYVGPSGKNFIGWDTDTDTLFGGTEYMNVDYEGSGGIAGTYADELGHRPFRDFATVDQIEEYSWPSTEWFDFSSLPEKCERQREYALVLGGWSPIVSRVLELFGMEKGLMYFYDRPDLIHKTIEKVSDFYYDYYDAALTAADGGIQVIGYGDDFATQRDLLLGPEMWRDFCREPLARLFSLGKKHGVFVYFHSCGAVSSILDDLVEIGLDVLYPVQPNALGMDHRELKERHGDKLSFWGGIDVQHVLPFGTEEEVRRHVRERIETLGAGGGYILASSHNLLKAFPLANILAMYDEAMKTPVSVVPGLSGPPTGKETR